MRVDGDLEKLGLEREAGSLRRLLMVPARPVPGVVLCLAVTGAAMAVQELERRLFGAVSLEALVLAIVIGAMTRTCWIPDEVWRPGIQFCAKTLLEIAVVLLGTSVSARVVLAAGPALLVGVVAVVFVAIGCSYGIGRALGLSARMATLVACGNSICGNSAIAAVAPVIGADGDDVAASIAFTAVLGVALVLGLPLLVPLLHLHALQYGALAGLTVYAVPQVLAATAAAGSQAVQLGTLVKLVRVMTLGPIVLGLSLLVRRSRSPGACADPVGARPSWSSLAEFVPWFIVGFLALAALRSCGLVPEALLPLITKTSSLLTVVAMAALGLGTDVMTAARAGGRVTTVVILSLLLLGGASFALVRLLAF